MADNWLKEYGFNALLLPRRDLGPKDLLMRSQDGFDQKVGTVEMMLSSADALPGVSSGEPTGSLSRKVEKKVEVGLGLKILGALLGAATAGKLGATAKVQRASHLVVSYEDVVQDSVAVLALQAWLESADVTGPKAAQVWLNDERLAAVTSVLRSAKLSIVAETQDGASIDLDVPEIQGLISGDAKVEVSSSSTSKVTFTGPTPIAFGFQAFVLRYEGNVSFGLEPLKGITARRPDPAGRAAVDEHAVEELRDATIPVAT